MIFLTHHTGGPYGLLGPQMAATYLQRNLSIPSLVVGIERHFSKERLFHFLEEYYTALPTIDGKKIPFELIDEYPLCTLGVLLREAIRQPFDLSQIHLVCRVDDINTHAESLPDVLTLAREYDVKIHFASIGFESFSDRLLEYFAKGITFSDIVRCVEILRRLKDRFPDHLFYRRDEGANHGFIRPTPWDDGETLQEINRNIFLHRLYEDILPDHSIPLIIHHASYLANWIREIEMRSDIIFGREGTWIEWWNPLRPPLSCQDGSRGSDRSGRKCPSRGQDCSLS